MRVDIAEICSSPRTTKMAEKMGLQVGEAMDLTTDWDFDNAEDRGRAEKYVMEEKPTLLIGSPMCTAFSQLQRLNAKGAHSAEKLSRPSSTWSSSPDFTECR